MSNKPEIEFSDKDGFTTSNMDSAIEKLLSAGTPENRCFARLLATEIPAILDKFINSEMKTKTSPADVQYALIQLQVNVSASIYAQTSPMDEKTKDLITKISEMQAVMTIEKSISIRDLLNEKKL